MSLDGHDARTPHQPTGSGSRAAGGLRWAVGQTIVSKAVATVSYVALGWLLTAEEFGLYAFVVGIAVLARAFQNRGIREILVSRGLERFASRARSVLRYGLLLNTVAASGFLLAGWLLRGEQPREFLLVVGLVCLSIPLTTPWSLASAKLSMRYRFDTIAKVDVAFALVQYGTAVVLSFLGLGAVGLAAALVAAAAYRGAVGVAFTWHDLRAAPTTGERLPYFRPAAWLILAAAGFGAFEQGDYFVAGLLLPAGVVGVYYFAYQLPLQLSSLLGASLHAVLLPWMADLHRHDPARVARSLARASDGLVLAVGAGGLVLAVAAPLLESLLWSGRWAEAVVPIQVLSLIMPMRALLEPPKALLLGSGRFRRWAAEACGLGLAAVAGALVGSRVGGTALSLAAAVGLATVVATISMWYRVARQFGGVRIATVGVRRLVATYALATAAGWAFLLSQGRPAVAPGIDAMYALTGTAAVVVTGSLLLGFRRAEVVTLARLAVGVPGRGPTSRPAPPIAGTADASGVRVAIDVVGIAGGGGVQVASEVLAAASRDPCVGEAVVFANDPDLLRVADDLPRLLGVAVRSHPLAYRLYWWVHGADRASRKYRCRAVLHLGNVALGRRNGLPSAVLVQQLHALVDVPGADDSVSARLRYRLLSRLVTASCRRADRVFVQSEYVRDVLVSATRGDCHPVVGYPVPPSSLGVPASGLRSSMRAGHRLVYVGSDRPHKNLGQLLAATALLQERQPTVEVHLTTHRPAPPPAATNVVYHGHLDRPAVAELIASGVALVMPSLAETVGLPMLEAMALDVPVLAADLPYARAVCADAALYFDPHDPEALAAACVRVVEDQDLRTALVEAGTRRLAELRERRGDVAMIAWAVGAARR